MARVYFGSGIVLELYFARDPFTSELFRVSLYQETLYSKWATYWVRSAKRITRINCSTQTVRYVNITSNWISEIQQCFWSTQQPYGRIQYFKSQLLGNNILVSAFNFCIDFIDFIFICCYHHLCNYCNRVFSDQPSNAVCRCLCRGCCYFNVYKTNQLTGNVYNARFGGNNKGERRYKILLCKVCFPARKDKQRDREPSPSGPFYRPKWSIFQPFHILQLVKTLLFCIPDPLKDNSFARSLPIWVIMWSTPWDKSATEEPIPSAIYDLRNEHF